MEAGVLTSSLQGEKREDEKRAGAGGQSVPECAGWHGFFVLLGHAISQKGHEKY